jgi:hypothetical protein
MFKLVDTTMLVNGEASCSVIENREIALKDLTKWVHTSYYMLGATIHNGETE